MSELVRFVTSEAGKRLDQVVTEFLGERLSRSQVQQVIRTGGVTVDGVVLKPGIKLRGGEEISVTLPDPPQSDLVIAQAIPLKVMYEDDDLAVIDKPAGLVVHPGAGNRQGTLVNALLARYPEIAQMNYAPERRGIVHRLDKDTSGLLVVARRGQMLQRLAGQFQKRTVEKRYLALVEKAPPTSIGRITAPIARDPANRQKMTVLRSGRPAETEYRCVEWFSDGKVLVEIHLLTGRTHQIRVHMAFIDCPIVGDTVYGRRQRSAPIQRQFLHASKLCIDHPRTRERLCFESPLPPDLEQAVDFLRKKPR
ncbi:MAG: RluA family pseudouridine synthase [Anaerolineae bacterium]|nr:RluA family pseudouridine synthase [Anaerolineae bacterium]NUQ03232.1 RluA family pseudouridine synthase [Anaerolineae bacterium]